MANRVKGITVEIDGNTTKLTKALEGVNKTVRTTQSELRDTQKLLKLDPTNTTLLKQKQDQLNTAIAATKEKLSTLKTAAQQANDALARGDISREQYDALQREIIETEQELRRLETEANNSSTALAKIGAAGEKLQSVGSKISGIGQSLLPLTGAVAGVGTVAAKKFAEVDQTMQLTNATMKNSTEEANMLDKAMKDAASNSTFGMSDAATATLNFARAGLSAEQAAAALAPAMNLAAGEGGSLDTVSAGLVATINGFHGSFDDAAKYADVFAAACNNSALDVDSLSQSMSVAAPIFSSAGYKVNDAALYMGVMANNGIEASVAANSLKTGFAKLVSPAKEGAAMMEKLGISVTEADGSMKNSITVQKELNAAFSQLSESEQIAAASAIFGKNQMAPWLALINTAPSDVDELSQSINNCKGTTDEMAQAMMSGFGGSIEQLKSSIDVLLTSLGQLLAQYLTPIIAKIQELVTKFNNLNPKTQDLAVKIGLVAAAIGPALIAIGKLTSGAGSILSMVSKIGGALGGLSVPFMAVIAVVGLLAGAFVAFKTSGKDMTEFFDGIKEKLSGFLSTVSLFIQESLPRIIQSFVDIIPEFASFASELISTLAGFITELLPQLIPVALQLVQTLITGIVQALPTLVQAALDILMALINAIVENLPLIVNAALQIVTSLINGIIQSLPMIIDAAVNIITTLVQALVEQLPQIINAALQLVMGLVQGILDNLPMIIQAALDLIITLVQAIMDNLPMIIQAAVDLITALVKGLVDSLPMIIEAVFELITGLVGAIIDNLPMIIEAAIQIICSLVQGLVSAIPQVLSTIWDLIKNMISSLLNGDWLGTGVKILKALLNGLISMVGSILSSIGDLVGSIFNLFLELPGKMLDIGKNIIYGIWDGICAVGDWLWDKISGFFDGIWDGICDFFGINSPSKLFKEELGFNLVYGLADGIDDKVKTAVTAVNNMGKDVMKAASGSLDMNLNGSVMTSIGSTPSGTVNNYYSTDNSRTVNQTNNSPKSLSRLEIYRQTRNALKV